MIRCRRSLSLCLGTAALLAAGCKREDIRVYTVLKDAPATPASATTRPPESPKLGYVLPPGWEVAAGNSMSVASFRIASAQGAATVSITPLAAMAGKEAAIVNMWREQVGQPALDAAGIHAALTPVMIAGAAGQLFEITGEQNGAPMQVVTAFVHRGDASWFYKLQGPEAVVTAQKPRFIEFLQTVQIEDRDGAPAAPAR